MGLKGRKYCGIDAKPCLENNPLRYINGARTAMQRRGINCHFYQKGDRVYFATLKAVSAGQELIVDYGENYWEGTRRNARVSEILALQALIRKQLREAKTAKQRAKLQVELEDAIEDMDDFIEDES